MDRKASPNAPLALVTGASRGIGAAIAERLCAAGAEVVLSARGGEACEQAAARLRRAGHSATALALDVGNAAEVAAFPGRLREKLGSTARLDWLVNNAGFARSNPLERSLGAGLDEYQAHFEVNLLGAVRLVHAFLADLKASTGGRVVNVASSAGLYGYAYVSAYCASKHALCGYTRAAALELKKSGVHMHAVCPHYVESPMLRASIETMRQKTGQSEAEVRDFIKAQNPGGRLIGPEEVAEAVHSLLQSERTGILLELDGAQRIEHT